MKYQNGTTYYLHTDMLATTGMVTDQTGTSVPQDMLYYPWGAVRAQYNMVDERFAGLRERDAESQLDPTPNRLYYNYLGRWLTADPAGTKAVTLTDPQTWNMYAYVRNNPTTLTDPSGLCFEDLCVLEFAAGAALVSATSAYLNSPSGHEAMQNAANLVTYSFTAATNGVQKLLSLAEDNSSENTGKKPPPNPHGSPGKPDHQEKVQELVEKAQQEESRY